MAEKKQKHRYNTENTSEINFDSSKVCVKFSDIHGRGVFAKETFDMHTVLEVFPITPCVFRTNYQGDPTVVHYSFINDACDCEECQKHGFLIHLSSGYGNMYNHQHPENCNARLEINYKELYGKVIAIKTIRMNEEITVYYGPQYNFPEGEIIQHEDSPR
tara:strand:- start:490 stop:969 length:480 start_codon:yes stop_codon:yes gene_type:complete